MPLFQVKLLNSCELNSFGTYLEETGLLYYTYITAILIRSNL